MTLGDDLIANALFDDRKWMSVFGAFIAEPGGKYLWRIKIRNGDGACIGVIDINKYKNYKRRKWWDCYGEFESEQIGYAWNTGTGKYTTNKIRYES